MKMIVRVPRTILDHSRPPPNKKKWKDMQNYTNGVKKTAKIVSSGSKNVENRKKIPLSISLLGRLYWYILEQCKPL